MLIISKENSGNEPENGNLNGCWAKGRNVNIDYYPMGLLDGGVGWWCGTGLIMKDLIWPYI